MKLKDEDLDVCQCGGIISITEDTEIVYTVDYINAQDEKIEALSDAIKNIYNNIGRKWEGETIVKKIKGVKK